MPVVLAPFTVTVRARPAGLWTLANEFIEGPRLLKISANADDTWAYADAASARCGPDGHPNALLARANCLVPEAPVGALIGKFGGSSAGKDGTPFVVGRYCVVPVPEAGGPLFLTINDEFGGMQNNADTIQVDVSEITVAAKPTVTQPFACCALLAALAKAQPTESNPGGGCAGPRDS